jgi:very-short-patch-repair endonuclease
VKVERALERLGGASEAWILCRLTSRARVRVALARGRIVRDARGRYALPGADHAMRKANELSGVLCLDSAARHRGWLLKRQPQCPSVAVLRKRKMSPDRRVGVKVVYVDLADDDIDGYATAPVRTVMDCASRLPFDETLAIADSALRCGEVTREQLIRGAERMPARYRARCLRVARAADGRADNPFESVLRAIALDVPGLHVQPQISIDGVGRPDLADLRLRLVIEAESFEFHGKRLRLKRDCERYNALVVDGWLVVRFAWEHVMFQPEYVSDVLRAAVVLLTRRPSGPALGTPAVRRSA